MYHRDEIDVDNPHYEPRAQELLKDLLMQLHSKTGVLVGDDFFLIRMRLEQTYTLFEVNIVIVKTYET